MSSAPCATFISCLLLSALLSGADRDARVASQMRVAVPGSDQVQILARVQAESELDVVVVLAASKEWGLGDSPWLWWDDKGTLGIFAQRRQEPGTVYKIAVQQGSGCGWVKVERATSTEVVLSCRPEKGNVHLPNHKFFYNLRSKALTGQLAYQPFSVPRLFSFLDRAVLVGSDLKELIALEFDQSQDAPFHLLRGSAAEHWTNRVRKTANIVSHRKLSSSAMCSPNHSSLCGSVPKIGFASELINRCPRMNLLDVPQLSSILASGRNAIRCRKPAMTSSLVYGR